MRIIKSAVAVLICFLIYILRGNNGIPFYSAIAAILCMQPYIGTSLQAAKSRTIGTIIGGLWGFLIIILDMEIHFTQIPMLHYSIVALMIIPVIYTTVIVKKQEASYITCVVFLSIVVEKVAEANAYFFVMNRLLDTLIGIAISLVINQIDIPRKRNKLTLFVSGLDEVLLNEKNKMSDYSKIELNRMIKDGALFTVATERTVAATIEAIQGIKIKLPVITYDGSLLYDLKENRVLEKYAINREIAEGISEIFTANKICCFTTGLVQNTILIYYQELFHETEKDYYEKMRISPYRNFINDDMTKTTEPIYLLGLGTMSQISVLYHQIRESSFSEHIRMVRVTCSLYEGCAFLKIYDKNALKQNMLEKLQEKLPINEVITFGSRKDRYHIYVQETNPNKIVKRIKNLYEPPLWQRKSKA